MAFMVDRRDGRTAARTGRLATAHGTVRTPAFMPVGTRANVRTMKPDELISLGFEMVLANAYHLMLRPGIEVVEMAGGLHRFMGWPRAILTDSGGYQVFSLAKDARVTDDGVEFRSDIDGSLVFLTPESCMESQARLGSDIAMSLDECLPYPSSREEASRSVELNRRWAERSRRAHARLVGGGGGGGLLFGIVQGGMFPDLRLQSARLTVELGFDGYAIGGLSVGEPAELTSELVGLTAAALPEDRPRYLMGVGDPPGILEAVASGVDLFDSAYPTRIARNGCAICDAGRMNLRNARYARDSGPLVEGCSCYACRRFPRSYLRHLVVSREILGLHLLTLHNLHYMARLLERVRDEIERGSFSGYLREFSSGWGSEQDE